MLDPTISVAYGIVVVPWSCIMLDSVESGVRSAHKYIGCCNCFKAFHEEVGQAKGLVGGMQTTSEVESERLPNNYIRKNIEFFLFRP